MYNLKDVCIIVSAHVKNPCRFVEFREDGMTLVDTASGLERTVPRNKRNEEIHTYCNFFYRNKFNKFEFGTEKESYPDKIMFKDIKCPFCAEYSGELLVSEDGKKLTCVKCGISVEKGEKIFTDLDIEAEWASTLTEIARQKIKIDTATVKCTIEISSTNPAGIDDVKTALINAKKIEEPSGTQINVYSIGAPKYRVEITAKNYSIAEKALEESTEEAIKKIKSLGGTGHKIN